MTTYTFTSHESGVVLRDLSEADARLLTQGDIYFMAGPASLWLSHVNGQPYQQARALWVWCKSGGGRMETDRVGACRFCGGWHLPASVGPAVLPVSPTPTPTTGWTSANIGGEWVEVEHPNVAMYDSLMAQGKRAEADAFADFVGDREPLFVVGQRVAVVNDANGFEAPAFDAGTVTEVRWLKLSFGVWELAYMTTTGIAYFEGQLADISALDDMD